MTQREPARPKAADVTTALVFGKAKNGPGAFGTIDGVGVDPRLFILAAEKQSDQLFHRGRPLSEIVRRTGEGEGQFNQCTGIVVDGRQRIIVTDQGNFRVQVFDLEGKFLTAFGRKGTGDGGFRSPWDWPWTPGGTFTWVTDPGTMFRFLTKTSSLSGNLEH